MRIRPIGLIFLIALSLQTQSARSQNPFGTSLYPVRYSVGSGMDAVVQGDLRVDGHAASQNPAGTLFQSTDSRSVATSAGADTASASASYSARISFSTQTSHLTANLIANGTSAANYASSSPTRPIGDFNFTMLVEFEVESGDATLKVFGDGDLSALGGSSLCTTRAEVSGPIEGGFFQRIVTAEGGSQSAPIDETFALGPGTYQVRFYLIAEARFFGETSGAASTSGSFNVGFSVSPPNPDEVFWSVNDGDFGTAENWEPQTVPGNDQTAVFDRDADYTVTIGNEETGRAIVERGKVTFAGGDYSLVEGTEDNGSLVVGGSAADFPILNLDLDRLDTLHAIVGDGLVTDGAVNSSESCIWTNPGRLSVGKAGVGSVSLENQARLVTGELRLGDLPGGQGSLAIRSTMAKGAKQVDAKSLQAGATAIGLGGIGKLVVESGALQTGPVEIGSLAGSVGNATLAGIPVTAVPWVADSLTVGNAGNGELSLLGGNTMRVDGDIQLAVGPDSLSEILVNGSLGEGQNSTLVTFNGTMTIGGSGFGSLAVEAGALCGASEVVIGDSPVGDIGGGIFVRGMNAAGERSMLTVFNGPLRIGRRGTTPSQITGLLSLEEGGEVHSNAAFVGERGGSGRVGVEAGCTWVLSGALVTSSADATVDPPVPLTRAVIFNHGLIQAQRIAMEIGTELYGEGVYSASEFIDYAGALFPETEAADTKGPTQFAVMTFDGDFNMERGEFILDVGGAGANQSDGIAIIGDANITGGTITFNFVDGFLPQMGEMIPFLDISGNTVFENVQTVYTGAADGFEYDLVEQDGMLMLEALNDAQPAPVPSGDLNKDGDINFIDLLIFLTQFHG